MQNEPQDLASLKSEMMEAIEVAAKANHRVCQLCQLALDSGIKLSCEIKISVVEEVTKKTPEATSTATQNIFEPTNEDKKFLRGLNISTDEDEK